MTETEYAKHKAEMDAERKAFNAWWEEELSRSESLRRAFNGVCAAVEVVTWRAWLDSADRSKSK